MELFGDAHFKQRYIHLSPARHPKFKKETREKYIEPIYCKFLNRSVVHEILRRKHLLKHARNEHNGPYFIKENLTLNRRLLWDSVEEKLGHFRYKWVKRGNIYVRERANSKVIKVLSERVLNELVAKSASLPALKEPIRKDPSPERAHRNVNLSNKETYANRCASIVNSTNFPRRQNYSQTQPKLPFQPINSRPLFSFRNTSFVDYRSSAF